MTKKIYMEVDGCNRRLLEQAKFKNYLILNDYVFVDSPAKADVILIATCAFKKKEEDESVNRLRRMRKFKAQLLVYGCLPDIAPSRFEEFSDIRWLAPKDIDKIDSFFDNIKVQYSDVDDSNVLLKRHEGNWFAILQEKLIRGDLFKPALYQRAFATFRSCFYDSFMREKAPYHLFVARGCLGKCSYCAIRFSIGKVTSKSEESVLREFRQGLEKGYRNFSILGDDTGSYGQDKGTKLPDLLSRLIDEGRRYSAATSVPSSQIRLSIKEIHPKWLIKYSDEFIRLLSNREFEMLLCPIQSGSDRVLSLMQREHTAEELMSVHQRIRAANPQLHFSTQVIAGFPSETEAEFSHTLDFLEKGAYDSVVVFPYHEKENTVARGLADKVPQNIIQSRLKTAKERLGELGIKVYFKCPL